MPLILIVDDDDDIAEIYQFVLSAAGFRTARATNEDIIVDHSELEDARWFDRAEATLMIKRQHPDGLAGPHPFAIAHHLLGRWVHAGPANGA